MSFSRSLVLALVLAPLSACPATRLDSETGRHVTVHWDPNANSLCGGTVFHIDRSLENIASTYGVPLPAQPSIDIFWTDRDLIASACKEASGCVLVHPNGTTTLLVTIIIHDHELAHAVRLTGSRDQMPSFFLEGVATRWENGPSDPSVGKEEYIGNPQYSLVRELVGQRQIADEYYPEAGFFWAWLEGTFGAESLADFASRLSRKSGIAHVESAFEQVFGVSLAEAVEMSTGQPLLMADVQACAMSHVPELRWENSPLLISSEITECSHPDIINTGQGAGYIVHLSLPDVLSKYSVEIEGPSMAEVRFDRCTGAFRPYENALQLGSISNPIPLSLSGDYAVTISAPIGPNGTIELPSVRISAP